MHDEPRLVPPPGSYRRMQPKPLVSVSFNSPSIDSLLLFARSRLFIRLASSAEDVRHCVIPLMTSILINRACCRQERVLHGPVPGKCSGIVDRDLVQDRIRVHPGEALDGVQVFARTPKAGLGGEVGGVDNQSVAFPMAD